MEEETPLDMFESEVDDELALDKERIRKENNMIPFADVTSGMIKKLLKDYYSEDALEHMTIPEANIPLLMKSLRTLNKNVMKFSAPLVCLGPKCSSSGRCPLLKAGVAPLTHACPLELMLIDQWEKEYVDDLGIDMQSKVELDMVRDLIEADLIDWRTSGDLAANGLYDWNTIGVTDNGKPIVRKEEAVSLSIKLKIKTRKDKIREELLATRKIKAKFGINKIVDPSSYSSDLSQRYKEIQEATVTESE